MDYAKGRAMIGKFEMGQIVPTPGAPTNESAANSPEMTIQEIVSCGELGRRAARAIVATEQADPFRRRGPFLFTTVSLGCNGAQNPCMVPTSQQRPMFYLTNQN